MHNGPEDSRRDQIWAMREKLPLHYIVFKQTASHIPQEANIEQLFSRSDNISDPNMDPRFLAVLTSIGHCEQEGVQADGVGDQGHVLQDVLAARRATPRRTSRRGQAPPWRTAASRTGRPTLTQAVRGRITQRAPVRVTTHPSTHEVVLACGPCWCCVASLVAMI